MSVLAGTKIWFKIKIFFSENKDNLQINVRSHLDHSGSLAHLDLVRVGHVEDEHLKVQRLRQRLEPLELGRSLAELGVLEGEVKSGRNLVVTLVYFAKIKA